MMRLYRGLLIGAMRARWLTILVTIGLFAAALFAVRFVPAQFFPASDRPELVVDMTLPHNASIFASERAAERLDAVLGEDQDVERWSTYVGQGAIRFYLPLDVQLPNDFFAQAVIVAKDVDARERLQAKLDQLLAEEFPGVVGRTYPLELGPPVGWPVQYRISGSDMDQVREIAFRLAQVMATSEDTRRINFDWNEPSRQVRIRVDQDEARRLGLSSQSLAAVLNAAVTGSTVTQMRDDIYLIDVVARATEEERIELATLRSLQVPLPNGRTVALGQFATFGYEQEYPLVWRRDRVPTLTVRADVDVRRPAGERRLRARARDRRAERRPAAGLSRSRSAASPRRARSRSASVFAVVPLMLLIMLTLLMFHLQSFQRLFMVLAILPLGLIGVVAALLVSGRPLGFVAILGILALIGMIAKNAVILITQIEADRAEGRERLGCGREREQLAPAADVADRDLDRAGADPDRADGVLGADGVRHHGRPAGRHHADPGLPADRLRHLVPR